jgi:hypothetical protein
MQMYGSMQNMLNSGYIWLLMLMMSVVALLPDILLRALQDSYSPVHSPYADSQVNIDCFGPILLIYERVQLLRLERIHSKIDL